MHAGETNACARRFARLESGLRQVELAKRVNIHASRLSQIENGHVRPRPEELQRAGCFEAQPELVFQSINDIDLRVDTVGILTTDTGEIAAADA